MAIYKLEDFAEQKRGKLEKSFSILKNHVNKYPIISAGVDIKGFYSKYNRDGKYICISSSGASAGYVSYYDGKFWASDCITLKLKSSSNICENYFKFLLLNKSKFFKKVSTGSAQKHVYWKNIKHFEFFIPSLLEQQKIIDIIKPVEKLFIKYNNCVRLNSFENTKKDIKKLIDIIEPVERLGNIMNAVRLKLKNLLKNLYSSNPNQTILLKDIIKLKKQNKEEQNTYLPTAAVSELQINFANSIDLKNEKKRISRANLTVKPNSLIISKLSGENKLLTISDWEEQFVFSTGFFNLTSENNSHLLGFFLSNDFKRQKHIFSTGTTMQAITNKAISFFKIKRAGKQNLMNLNLMKIFSLLNQIEFNLNKMKKLFIKLMFKE